MQPSSKTRPLWIALCSLLASLLVACEASALDSKMAELCQRDGGLRVFEVVYLPATSFDVTGRLISVAGSVSANPYRRYVAKDYVLEMYIQEIKAGDPLRGFPISEGRLLRFEHRAIRLSDQKLLGTEVSYGRSGGDITLGHFSQNFCPKPRPTPGLDSAVFRRLSGG